MVFSGGHLSLDLGLIGALWGVVVSDDYLIGDMVRGVVLIAWEEVYTSSLGVCVVVVGGVLVVNYSLVGCVCWWGLYL